MTAIHRAVSIAGSQSKLAAALGVSQVRVSQWCSGEPIPVRYWPLIERASERKVTMTELLSDELAKLPSEATA